MFDAELSRAMLAGLVTGGARLTNRNIFYHRLSAFPLSRQDHREHFVQFLSAGAIQKTTSTHQNMEKITTHMVIRIIIFINVFI